MLRSLCRKKQGEKPQPGERGREKESQGEILSHTKEEMGEGEDRAPQGDQSQREIKIRTKKEMQNELAGLALPRVQGCRVPSLGD